MTLPDVTKFITLLRNSDFPKIKNGKPLLSSVAAASGPVAVLTVTGAESFGMIRNDSAKSVHPICGNLSLVYVVAQLNSSDS